MGTLAAPCLRLGPGLSEGYSEGENKSRLSNLEDLLYIQRDILINPVGQCALVKKKQKKTMHRLLWDVGQIIYPLVTSVCSLTGHGVLPKGLCGSHQL